MEISSAHYTEDIAQNAEDTTRYMGTGMSANASCVEIGSLVASTYARRVNDGVQV